MIKKLFLTLGLGVLIAAPGLAQTSITTTTLAEVLDAEETGVTVASATGIVVGDLMYVDREAMRVRAINGTVITVARGQAGTRADDHATSRKVWHEVPSGFIATDLIGTCTAGSEYPNFTPLINPRTGNAYTCTNSVWTKTNLESSTMGDGEARDVAFHFDGNAQDFFFGLDDSADDLVFGSGSTIGTDNILAFPAQSTTTSGQRAIFYGEDPATAADNDESYLSFFTEDDAAAQVEIGRIAWKALDVSAADDDSEIVFSTFVNNTFMDVLTIGSQDNTATEVEVAIGDGGEEDTALLFDGNAVDYYVALDDSLDELAIGYGAVFGTTPVLSVTNSGTLVMEGATDDGFEATVSVEDPTADYNVTLGEFTVCSDPKETSALHVDSSFFIATRPYQVLDIDAIWDTAESTGDFDTMIQRLQGTETPSGGDDLLSAVFDASTNGGGGTAATVNNGALTATASFLDLAVGDRLAIEFQTGTPNEIIRFMVCVRLSPQG